MLLELPPKFGRKYSDIKMESQRKVFAFKLNKLEFETIRNLFIHYNWDFDNALLSENKNLKQLELIQAVQEVHFRKPCQALQVMLLLLMMMRDKIVCLF